MNQPSFYAIRVNAQGATSWRSKGTRAGVAALRSGLHWQRPLLNTIWRAGWNTQEELSTLRRVMIASWRDQGRLFDQGIPRTESELDQICSRVSTVPGTNPVWCGSGVAVEMLDAPLDV